jgi:probable addiction module antidote protein
MNRIRTRRAPSARAHEPTVVGAFRRDRRLAAAYLDEVLADGDQQELMLALRRLSEALGGVPALAQQAGLNATTLYRTLSADGNPELRTLRAMLAAMGLRLSVSVAA